MKNWLVRGLVFAAVMLAVRLVQGALINAFPTKAELISAVLVLVFAVLAALWGVRDGRADATAHADPDRRDDLAMVWLVAGLIAGALSGAAAWLIGLFDNALYSGGLLSEVTTFASFTALLVFLSAIGGVSVGRMLVDRQREKNPERFRSAGSGIEGSTDTDVFATVGAPQEATQAAITADDAPTTVIPTEESGS